MEYFAESSGAGNPTLEEMTRSALQLLQSEPNGYVLLVEGGRIDQAHHDGRAKLALEEALQFDSAIETALNMTDPYETLIIVTADHSHTMTINGYPGRGNDILGTLTLRHHLSFECKHRPRVRFDWRIGCRLEAVHDAVLR